MNITELKAEIAGWPDDMKVTVNLTEGRGRFLLTVLPEIETDNPLYVGPTYTTVKSLLLSPVPLSPI